MNTKSEKTLLEWMESITTELGPDCGHLCTLVDEFRNSLQPEPTPPEPPAPAPVEDEQAVDVGEGWRELNDKEPFEEGDEQRFTSTCDWRPREGRFIGYLYDKEKHFQTRRRIADKPVAEAAPAALYERWKQDCLTAQANSRIQTDRLAEAVAALKRIAREQGVDFWAANQAKAALEKINQKATP